MLRSFSVLRRFFVVALVALSATAAHAAISPGDLVIREFRLRGTSATDEYIEIANRTGSDITVAATDASAGFGIVAQNAGACPTGTTQLLATIPNGTVIPAGGAYLAAHNAGYSLSAYGGAGAAAPNATWTVDVCDGSGVGLFSSSTTFDDGTALDRVSFATFSAIPFIEGPGLPATWGAIAAPGQYAFLRKAPYRTGGAVQDTNENDADFHFISIDAGVYSTVQSALGTPGPQKLASPVTSLLTTALADPAAGANSIPNRTQSGNYHYFRRMITNNTGAPITKLRFRIADISTLFGEGYNPALQADWRGIDTTDVVITLTDTTTPTAKGLTLEAPTVVFSAVGKGAGYNASATVNLGGALADNASLFVNIGMRQVKGGPFYFLLVPESATTPPNAAPLVTTSGGTSAFVEDAGSVVVDGALTVTDDGGTLDSATVTITNLLDAGSEILSATPSGTILAGDIVYAAPTLTITRAGATVADYQAVLRSVRYNNTSDAPATTARIVTFVGNDGSLSSTTASKTVSVAAVNDAPVLSAGATLAYTENDPATFIEPFLGLTDPDSTNLTAASVVTITNATSADVLSITSPGPLAVSIVAPGQLFLSGTATVATYLSALRSVRYSNTSESPSTLPRTIQWRATDDTTQSVVGVTSTINITAVNDAPVLTSPASVNVNEDTQTPSIAISVSDVDSGAGTNFQATLSAAHGKINVTPGGATVVGNNTANVTITGTVASVNTALGTTKYTGNLNFNGTDTLAVNVTDNGQTGTGGALADGDNITINVAAVNDPPVVTPPAAYSAMANMKVTGLGGLLGGASDAADNGVSGCVSTSFSVKSGSISATSPPGGQVSNVNLSAGTFDFDPPPGATGSFTFTYVVSDTGCAGVADSAPVTATVNVSGPVIWFVDAAVPGPGDGRLSNPFKTLASADAVDATGHSIFLASGTYATGIALNQSEALIGQGVSTVSNPITTSFDVAFGISPPPGTIARPAIAGTRPIVQGTVTVNTNTQVSGLDIASTTTTGLTDPGGSIAGVFVSEVAVTTSSGSAIALSDVNLSFLYFSGVVTGGGAGVSLTGTNTGANFSFTGVSVSSGANAAFTATGGGTVIVTGANNTLTSTTATALNVTDTTIGAAGLTFQSISSGTSGANSSSNGIILSNTGSSGGLTVTGSGTAGSGGTIQRKTGADGSTTDGTGIFLSSTTNPSFARMILRDFQNYGIRGLSVTGFTLDNSIVDTSAFTSNGTTAATDEGSISFGAAPPTSTNGLLGTATITNSTIRDGFEDNLNVFNFSGTLDLTISNAIIRNTGGTVGGGAGNDGILIKGYSSATNNVEVKGSQFIANHGDHFNATADGSANLNVQFGNNGANSLTGGHPTAVGQGIAIQTGGQWSGTGTFNVSNNTIVNAIDTPINVNSGGTGTFTGTIHNNTIGETGVANSGTCCSEQAIRIVANGDKGALGAGATGGTLTVAITNNTIQQVSDEAAIYVLARDGGTVADPIELNATITGNLLREPAPGLQAIRAEAGASSTPTPDRVKLCVDIGGAGALANTVQGDWGIPVGADEIRLRHQFSGTSTFRLPGFVGLSPTGVPAYLTGRNSGFPPGTASATLAGGGAYTGGAACPVP